MRRLVLAAGAALVLAGCTVGDEPDARGAVVAQVSIPDQPPAITHGNDPLPPRPAGLTATLGPEVSWPCEGTGEDGRRVQLLYVHGPGFNLQTNRATFESIARHIEAIFQTSARAGGGERLVRFVTGAGCALSIQDVPVSPAALSSFDVMISELRAAGYGQSNRIYHSWVEGNAYCGIGTVYTDDQPVNNANEAYAQYSRSDRQCWDYAEWHEITHNLGGVQNSAPHSTGGLHCRDEYDVMCYPDGGPNGSMIQPYLCPDAAFETRLDCKGDDYFNAGTPSGYLSTHWNTANAAALTRTTGTTLPPPPPTSSTTVPPTTSTTTVGGGSTRVTLVAPSAKVGVPSAVRATVTGTCKPQGTVAFYVSGRLLSRQVVDATGVAAVSITYSSAGRFTVRADYEGSNVCATSRDTVRPRVS